MPERRDLGPTEQLTVKVPLLIADLVRLLAEREGLDVAEWLRRAAEERANRQQMGGEWVGPLPPEG